MAFPASGGSGGGGSTGQAVYAEVPSGTKDGVNATFTLAHIPSPANTLQLYFNGMKLKLGTGYTLSGLTITALTGFLPDTTQSPPDTYEVNYGY